MNQARCICFTFVSFISFQLRRPRGRHNKKKEEKKRKAIERESSDKQAINERCGKKWNDA